METNPDAPVPRETPPGRGPGEVLDALGSPSGLRQEAPNDPFIGRELAGKYRVVRRIGSGGMGAVYQAVHLTTGGDVALKFLHGTALGDENAIRRFQLEAQNVAALRHANTVRVIDFGVDQATLYLVMEYLDGLPLSDLLTRDGPLPWPRAVHILRQVLKSLWEAHEHPKRIIHRDIKPANIFVVNLPGDADHVRVVDFGIARALEGSGASTQGLLGTPFYMAPELWRGEAVDARTDLYALGCVAYQCLVGAPPFVPPPSATDSLYPLLDMHLNAPPLPLRKARPSVPAPLAEWVDWLLAKEPSRRPASARAALQALDEASRKAAAGDSEASHASSVAAASVVSRAAQQPATAATAGAPGEPTTPDSTRSRSPRSRSEPRAPTGRGIAPWLVVALVLGSIGALAALVAVLSSNTAASPTPSIGAAPASDEAEGHPLFGVRLVSYRARLSAADHLDEDGASLDDAAAIVTLDRIHYHAGRSDPEDEGDDLFALEAAQGQLYQGVGQFLDEPTRRAILEGQPLVEVAVFERGLTLRVVPQ